MVWLLCLFVRLFYVPFLLSSPCLVFKLCVVGTGIRLVVVVGACCVGVGLVLPGLVWRSVLWRYTDRINCVFV